MASPSSPNSQSQPVSRPSSSPSRGSHSTSSFVVASSRRRKKNDSAVPSSSSPRVVATGSATATTVLFVLSALLACRPSEGFAFRPPPRTTARTMRGFPMGRLLGGRGGFRALAARRSSSPFAPPVSVVGGGAAALASSSSSSSSANRELVERRIEINRAKRESRRRSLDDDRERNLRFKRLLHSDVASTAEEYEVPPMYAIKVSVCPTLRRELNLNGREKRGRMFVEKDGSDGCRTLKGLKFELHSFFRCLRKSSYLLEGRLPVVAEDGSILSPADAVGEEPSATTDDDYWPIRTDDDVIKTFEAADEFYSSTSTPLKRPSILIHVTKDPNAPEPPPPPPYLTDMADPKDSETMTMLSFYSFPPEGVADPEEFRLRLIKLWKPFDALGRVYVATEGVNAQMSVPTNVIDNFIECCKSIPELGEHMENGINIDPVPLTMDEFKVAGVPVNGEPSPPFRNLHVRVRHQVVSDGFDEPLDWSSAGYDMPPLEWHERLKEAKEKKKERATAAATARDGEEEKTDDAPLILDCRNAYETGVGRFEGSEPLNTESFRDSWDVLKERLADTPKDAPIMTYCTGGIRCVKVGAYLTQELNFTNVSRLAGGIVAYDRTLNEEAKDEEPMFKGTNYVFDGRVGRRITDDALGECVTCGARTSLLTNCENENCHRRMVQCEDCRRSFLGTCSDACKRRVLKGSTTLRGTMPVDGEVATGEEGSSSENSSGNSSSSGAARPRYRSLDEYSSGYSSPLPSLFREIELNTAARLPTGSHMISGAAQGRFLTQLTSVTREGRVLELGTFTGYATACFLEGASNAGEAMGGRRGGTRCGGRHGGPFVMTLERDSRAIDLAAKHLKIMSEFGVGERAAEEACKIRDGDNDAVPETAHVVEMFRYKNIAGCEIVPVTDALATVEEMAAGEGHLNPAPFDVVFVDADKTRLLDYVEACVQSDRVLKRGGLIVVDNVLWKGLVLEAGAGEFTNAQSDSLEDGMDGGEVKKSRRARKLATIMHNFNDAVARDDRLEVVLLPMRDGLSIIRKR